MWLASRQKTIASPGASADIGIACPTRACCWLTRGSRMPAVPKAHWTKPEQSHELGPTPPHLYGLPIWVMAALNACSPAGVGIGR